LFDTEALPKRGFVAFMRRVPSKESSMKSSIEDNAPEVSDPEGEPQWSIMTDEEMPFGFNLLRDVSRHASRSSRLILPTQVALEAVESHKKPADPDQASVPRSIANTATGFLVLPKSPVRSQDKHAVDLAPLTKGWRKPGRKGWVGVWSPKGLQRRIDEHNEGHGSSDASDRARNAAAYRKQLGRGPWRRCVVPKDVDAAVDSLQSELAHIPELVELVVDRLRMSSRDHVHFALPPVLLVGEPGVGKTHAVHRLAKILGLPLSSVDMSMQQTNTRLHGSDRHWGNATPGLLRELIVDGEVANPMVLLDELDKVRRLGSQYDPLGPLHNALEPFTACSMEDMCLPGPFDGSRIGYLATANTFADIPSSLLSRFTLVLVRRASVRDSLRLVRAIAEQVTSGLGKFEPVARAVIVELADRTPRLIRQLLERGASRAIAAGRRRIELRDVLPDASDRQLH